MIKKLTVPALLVLGALASAMVAGCGSNPTTPARTANRAQVQRNVPAATGQRMPAGQVGAASNPQLQQILGALHQANQAAAGFSATVETYDKGAGGVGTQTMKIAYRKPSSLKLDIIKDSGGNEGTSALWTGGSNIQVKPKFPPVTVSLSIGDNRLISKNGWTIKDTGVGALLNVLLDASSQVKLIGDRPIEGKTLTLLEVRSPASPRGATHEVIGIDRQVNLPAYRAIYKDQQLVFKLSIKSMRMTPPSSAEMTI